MLKEAGNAKLTQEVLQCAIDSGVRTFILSPGSRNSPFVLYLLKEIKITCYYWPEERSGAFFALGLSLAQKRPVAVVTTSGTAAGELLPAAMEAYYTGVPLLLITADRPRAFRGTGAPQAAEQEKLFGCYTPFYQDIAIGENCHLAGWDKNAPCHLNVCLNEPQSDPVDIDTIQGLDVRGDVSSAMPQKELSSHPAVYCRKSLLHFLCRLKHPIAIVSGLTPCAASKVKEFLLQLKMPAILEATSALREDPALQHLRIHRPDKTLQNAKKEGYEIDGVLRIGGVPTHRLWRDLEYQEDEIAVCHLSELPFSGLARRSLMLHGPISQSLISIEEGDGEGQATLLDSLPKEVNKAANWMSQERHFACRIQELCLQEPCAEQSLMAALSHLIPASSGLYLGNSMPIRLWDLAATGEDKGIFCRASRGLNGIDGQISTFLGLSQAEIKRSHWAIVGDLTALYDLVALWILPQLTAAPIRIVIINNGGGQIFSRLYPHKEFLHAHSINFSSLAAMWGLEYHRWNKVPQSFSSESHCLIEVVPDNLATERFWRLLQ